VRRALAFAVLVVGLLVAMVVAPGPASAPGGSGPLQVTGGQPLFDLRNIAPGMSGTEQLRITNRGDFDGVVRVTVVDLREDDFQCSEPERASGDTTCGRRGGGELGRDLLIEAVDESGRLLQRAPLRLLEDRTVVELSLRRRASTTVTFRWRYDPASGNETQSDRVSFDFQVSLSQRTGSHSGGGGHSGGSWCNWFDFWSCLWGWLTGDDWDGRDLRLVSSTRIAGADDQATALPAAGSGDRVALAALASLVLSWSLLSRRLQERYLPSR
jgi:hypothetical protein